MFTGRRQKQLKIKAKTKTLVTLLCDVFYDGKCVRVFWGPRKGETHFAYSPRLIRAVTDVLAAYTSEFSESLKDFYYGKCHTYTKVRKQCIEPSCTRPTASVVTSS